MKDGSWGLFVRSNPYQPTTKSRTQQDTFKFGSLGTNKWTDWVFRIRWSYGNDGIVQVWKNGTQVLNRTGPNCYNDETMPHFRMGIYKSMRRSEVGDVVERNVYHDEVRIAGIDPAGLVGHLRVHGWPRRVGDAVGEVAFVALDERGDRLCRGLDVVPWIAAPSRRCGTVSTVRSSGWIAGSSSQAKGVETWAPGRARTHQAPNTVLCGRSG